MARSGSSAGIPKLLIRGIRLLYGCAYLRPELTQLLQLARQRVTIERDVGFPRQHAETQAQPAFRLLQISRLHGRELVVTPGRCYYLAHRFQKARMVELSGDAHGLRQVI